MTTATMPPAPEPEDDILIRLDGAHKAFHTEYELYEAEQDKILKELWQRRAPYITEAKSVLLQVRAEAYRAGFSDEDLDKVAACSH